MGTTLSVQSDTRELHLILSGTSITRKHKENVKSSVKNGRSTHTKPPCRQRMLLGAMSMACLCDGRGVLGLCGIGESVLATRVMRQVAQTEHQSCLLLTSREKPRDKAGEVMLSIDLCEEYNDIVGDTGHSLGHPGDIVGHIILTPGCYGA